jgi:hypothetical protein
MESHQSLDARKHVLPVILLAAVIQGWVLYALHWSIENKSWPATQPGWLFASYAVAIFVPLTAQLLSAHARQPLLWILLGVVFATFGYFGWHQGAWVANPTTMMPIDGETGALLALLLGLIWLMSLPFLQVRLASGRWTPDYSVLFSSAWRNKLMLAEAALFTALFWILLVLWQQLFHMLGLNFFRELFSKPIFIYPVTSIVFGIALHLIGSVERLTSVLLEQLLNVLKWLMVVAGLLLVVFTISLIFKLPGMLSSDERAISTAWLLWLLAFLVLLINAAYRDGTAEQPYPRLIGFALRCAVPLMIIIALTACYAMWVRVSRYGVTVDRVWASIVALVALSYAIGYTMSVRAKTVWMSGIARVNVCVALGLIAVLMLTLTPALSPYRIAANSQARLAKSLQRSAPEAPANEQFTQVRRRSAPMTYLRFDAGRYGLERLREIAQLKDGANDSPLASEAKRLLATEERWETPAQNMQETLAKLTTYPRNTVVDEKLLQILREDVASAAHGFVLYNVAHPAGLFVDLNGDGANEFVLLGNSQGVAYRKEGEQWKYMGMLSPFKYEAAPDLTPQLESGDFAAEVPTWRELRIGTRRFRLQGEQ